MKKYILIAFIFVGTVFTFAKSAPQIASKTNNNLVTANKLNFENYKTASLLNPEFSTNNPYIIGSDAHFKCWLTSLAVYAAVEVFGGSSEDASYLMHLYRDTCNQMMDMADENNN